MPQFLYTMPLYMFLYILCLDFFTFCQTVHRVNENMRKKLNAVEQNNICCMNNLPCCKEPGKLTTFEVKSVITDCPNLKCTNYSSSNQIVVQHKPSPEKLQNCNQKLLLTIKIINEGIPNEKSQYVIIDHITDPNTSKKDRILNPYAVRIRQEPMLQVYDLSFERTVNSEAKEVVLNKHNRNYRGCDISSENPTCGLVEQDGKVVPYSAGFCCSCSAEKNRLMEEPGVQWPEDGGVPEYHKNDPGENDYEHYKHYGFTGLDGKMVYGRPQKDADKSVNYQQFTELKDGKYRQRRGGQSCDDVDFGSLPESFHESTHCLTFSNLWYGVYRIGKPRIVHKLRIQIFQKYEDCNGKTHWMDLTQGKVVEVGTHQPIYIEKDIIARYTSEDVEINDGALNYKAYKLLIPEKRIVDPEQFMILPKKMISQNGRTCDTVGVGYEAFYKQKKRCSMPPGSCLNNQPQYLRDQDLEAEKQKRPGSYFLKFFGVLAAEPVVYNSTGQIQYLKLVYTKRHVSNLYFEVNADLVTLLKPNAFATITEIYTDATDPSKTRIIVKVTNSGLLYGVFYVRLSGCPLTVPASFNNVGSKSVLIPAQHQHIFNLYIEYPLPVKELLCSIHVHNVNQELVASRQVRIQTYDRCICIWHCKCACYVTDGALKCIPMPLEEYHSAGFQGGFPESARLIEPSSIDAMFQTLVSMFMFLLLTLLVMGLVKALLGLCSHDISLWGLDTILGTGKSNIVCDNKECEFKEDDGVSVAGQFCLNVLFFLLYPLALCNAVIKKYCFSSYTMEDQQSREQRWVNYESCNDEVCPRSSKSTKSTVATDQSNASLKYTTSEDKSVGTESQPEQNE